MTNMRQTPRFLYEKVYCARGDAENRIKELKALQIDRTSCGHNSCVPELGCRARIVWISMLTERQLAVLPARTV